MATFLFFVPLCSLPENKVSCDSGSLKLSRAPSSTSLAVAAALHGGTLLGDCAKRLASYKQIAFSKLLSLTFNVLCGNLINLSPTLARVPVAVMNTDK